MSLKRLLEDRAKHSLAGIEGQKGGHIFYFTHTDHNQGRCQFCWKSIGCGYAVVEIWGAGGSGSKQCCCSPTGVPSNPGGYVKKKIRVCTGSYICGWGGCAPPATGLCYSGRSGCTTACYFNQGETCCVMRAEGGWGGWAMCHSSGSPYCCQRKCRFCSTLTNTYCGIVCNWCGPNGAMSACACGGDVCIPGGISCIYYWACCARCPWCFEETLSLPAGYFSSTCAPCVRFRRGYNASRDGAFPSSTGRANYLVATHGLAGGVLNKAYNCYESGADCGCYDIYGCQLSTPGFAGTSGQSCDGVRGVGMRGGMGAVRITWYDYDQYPFDTN